MSENGLKVIDNEERYDSASPKRFWMQRLKDATGVSATGRVLEGILWQSGKVTVEWRAPMRSMAIYDDLKTFRAIHMDCHPSMNELVWVDV